MRNRLYAPQITLFYLRNTGDSQLIRHKSPRRSLHILKIPPVGGVLQAISQREAVRQADAEIQIYCRCTC